MEKVITFNVGDCIWAEYGGNLFFGEDEEYMRTKNTTFMIDSTEFNSVHSEFIDQIDYDCYGARIEFVARDRSIEDLLRCIRAMDENKKVRFTFNTTNDSQHYIWGRVYDLEGSERVGLMNIYVLSSKPFYENELLRGWVSVFGKRDYVEALVKEVNSKIGHAKTPTVNWHYVSDGSARVSELSVSTNVNIKDEYYPFIPGGVHNFIRDYLASSESILILLGPPGTGKSTLLRNMIVENNLTATLTYEEKLLQQDKIFINYLSHEDSDLLILEDADVLLESRESAGNRIMQKLLNVSDGIVKVMNKKIIFTTNLTSTRNIDDALLRPGRCYAIILFRELTYNETLKAAEVAGIAPPKEHRNYTLAEMFQGKSNIDGAEINKKKVGFRPAITLWSALMPATRILCASRYGRSCRSRFHTVAQLR